jgi:hypothetical protein
MTTSRTKLFLLAAVIVWLVSLISVCMHGPDLVVQFADKRGWGGHGPILFIAPFLLVWELAQWPALVVTTAFLVVRIGRRAWRTIDGWRVP